MIIHFQEPPPAQKAGGLDAAIVSLRTALEGLGHTVSVNDPAPRGGVLHFHGLWQPQFPAIAQKAGLPYVVSPHGMLEPWAWQHRWWKKLPYWHLIEKRWTRRAACVLATAQPEAERLRRFYPHTRIEALPLGLTGDAKPAYAKARVRLGWAEQERVLLFLSRIHEKKGLDLLLEALTQLTVPENTRVVIVGPEEQPAYADKCKAFAAAHGAKLPRMEWVGPIWGEDRWAYLQGADLFCLPTHSENFGLVVLEACQVGTPVLTTTGTPWSRELDGRGFIAEPRVESLVAALADAFQNLSVGESRRTALSAWAWERFAWSSLAPRYAALYEGLGAA